MTREEVVKRLRALRNYSGKARPGLDSSTNEFMRLDAEALCVAIDAVVREPVLEDKVVNLDAGLTHARSLRADDLAVLASVHAALASTLGLRGKEAHVPPLECVAKIRERFAALEAKLARVRELSQRLRASSYHLNQAEADMIDAALSDEASK